MSRSRGSTTPMDFEWQNQNGPVDERSPFLTASQHAAKKRPHSALDSPSKNVFSTPNRPHLREPNSQPYLFSHTKPLPSIPSHLQHSKAWEPRTPTSVYDFSSGGETPTTPGLNDDSEASATPDTQIARKMGRLMDAESAKSHKKSRRESWFKSMFSASPSPSKDDSRKFSKKAENRVMKRRSKKAKFSQPEDAASDDEKRIGTTQQNVPAPAKAGAWSSLASFFTWIEAHPSLPSVLSYYLNLAVNTLLGVGFLYLLYSIWTAIVNEVELESRYHVGELMSEIANCAHQYTSNRCDPTTRAPALYMVCENWEKCMQRDPKKVARASVSMKTFAKIVNNFIDELSYKTLVFTAVVIFGGFNLSNWAFGFMREKNGAHQQRQHHDFVPPPATPQRYPSSSYLEHQQHWNNTPYQTPYGNVNQHILPPASQSMPTLPNTIEKEDRRSPSKRLMFK